MASALTCLLLLGWHSDPPSLEPPADGLVSVSSGLCFGECPSYTLVVHQDGKVDYDGKNFVYAKGARSSALNASELERVKTAISRAGFEKLHSEYPSGATDEPSTIVCLGAGKKRCVRFEPEGAPKEVHQLMDEIRNVVGMDRWILTARAYSRAIADSFFRGEAQRSIDSCTGKTSTAVVVDPGPLRIALSIASTGTINRVAVTKSGLSRDLEG